MKMNAKRAALIIAVSALCLLAGCSGNKAHRYNEEGVAFYEEGNYEEAKSSFLSAIEAEDGDDSEYLFNLGTVYYEDGDYENAVYFLTEAIDGTEESDVRMSALSLRADAFMQTGDCASAAEDYAELILAGEGTFDNCMGAYEAYLAAGMTDEAAGYIDLALSAASDGDEKAEAYCYKATSLMDDGDYDEALAAIESGLDENSEAVEKSLLYLEAACYEYLSDYATALEKWQAYTALYGADDDIRHEIAFLESRQ